MAGHTENPKDSRAILLLMRHAKSAWDGPGADFDRGLAARGTQDAPAVGRWLAGQWFRPGLIVSSPAVRARETARLVAAELAQRGPVEVRFEARIYEAELATLLAVLAGYRESPLLLVGHNPGFELLLAHLAGSEALRAIGRDKVFPTGAIYALASPGGWGQVVPGSAEIIAHTRPRALRGSQ